MPYFGQASKENKTQKKTETRNTTGSSVQSQAQKQAQSTDRGRYFNTQSSTQSNQTKQTTSTKASSAKSTQSTQKTTQQKSTQTRTYQQNYQQRPTQTQNNTIQAAVQSAPKTQQQTQKSKTVQKQAEQQVNPQKNQSRNKSPYQQIVTALDNRRQQTQANSIQNAPQTESRTRNPNITGRAPTPKVDENGKTNTGLMRNVTDTISDAISRAPQTGRQNGYQRTFGGDNVFTGIGNIIRSQRENRALSFGMSDAEQEEIARARGASEEDIALAKQTFAASVDYTNRNDIHGYDKRKNMRTAGGIPMDSWLRFLPDDDGSILERTANSARAGLMQHGMGFAGNQADIGNRLGADEYTEDRLKDYQYAQLLAQQALSGDNQGMYDRIVASGVQNGLTAAENTALALLFGLSPGTKPLQTLGMANMVRGAYGNSVANVLTGGEGEQYVNDWDAARRYGIASGLNEYIQENLPFESSIPGADVFGFGNFITEAVEEGVGTLLDPWTDAALEEDFFKNPFDYLARGAEIQREKGLKQNLTDAAQSALEGGISGFSGGVMANPYQSVRQMGTDINALRADLGSEGIRNSLREYEQSMQGEQGTGEFAPNPLGYSMEGALAKKRETQTGDTKKVADPLTGEVHEFSKGATSEEIDQFFRQADTDRAVADTEQYYDEAFSELNQKYYPSRQKEAVSQLKRLVSRGGLRSSIPSVKERAQRANAEIIKYDAKALDVQDLWGPITDEQLNDIISISNRVGIPVDFLPRDVIEERGAGAWYAPGPGGDLSLNTGVIHLPSSPIVDEPLISTFIHEITHTMEGSPEYFRLKQNLKQNSETYTDYNSKNITKERDSGIPVEDEDGEVLGTVLNPQYAEDRAHMFGTETIANRHGDFANKNIGTQESYATGKNNWMRSLLSETDANGDSTNLKTRATKAVTTGLGLEAMRAAPYIRNSDRLEYDPDFTKQLMQMLKEKHDKWETKFEKKNGRLPTAEESEKFYDRAKVNGYSGKEIQMLYLSSRRGTPANHLIEYNGDWEWRTPKVARPKLEQENADEWDLYSYGVMAKKLDNYSYRQDLAKTGLTEDELYDISDAVTDAMDGDYDSPLTKEAYDIVSKEYPKVKEAGFETFKRMFDDFDSRNVYGDEPTGETYNDAEEETTPEKPSDDNFKNFLNEYNDPYVEISSYLSSQGVAKSYADRLGSDLQKKGDYSPYNLERGIKSLKAKNKNLTDEQARAQLEEIRDEYNKRHPQGLESARAKAEQKADNENKKEEKKKEKNADTAAVNKMIAEENRALRNKNKNKSSKWVLSKDGKYVINTETGERKQKVVRKTDQDVFNSTVMGQKEETVKPVETKAEEQKVEQPKPKKKKPKTKVEEKVETKTEEIKEEERKEETPKEEIPKPVVAEQQEAETAPTKATEEPQMSDERRQELETLAYFRNQDIENANLPTGMERVERKADTETSRAPKERVQTKSRIGKADTEVASMDAQEMIRYFRQEDWEGSEEYSKKSNGERDSIDSEIDTLVDEVANSKEISREEGDVYNTLAAILYRAGGKLEHVNSLAKTYEETGEIKGRRDIERDILKAHQDANSDRFKDTASAEEFVRRVVNAWKNSSQDAVEMAQTNTESKSEQKAEPGYEYDAVDSSNATTSESEKTGKLRKKDAIYETAQKRTEDVSKVAKEVTGKEFTKEQKESITATNERAEEIRQDKVNKSQEKAEKYVEEKVKSQQKNTSEQKADSTAKTDTKQEAKGPTQEQIYKAGSDRLNYAKDFSESQTGTRMTKEKFYDEGLRARIDESHKIKPVKHDADIKADAKAWRDESGLGGVVAYAEGKNLQNSPTNTVEEEMYLIEGLKDLSKLSTDIRKNIERLEKQGGNKEAISELKDHQKETVDSAVSVFEAIQRGGSEAGRTLRNMRYLYETPELIPAYMQRKVDQLNRQYEKQLKGNKITLNQELMDKISDPSITEEERSKLWDEINYDIADQLPRTLSGRVTQWRKTGMLANPRTHMRNVISNLATYGMFNLNDTVQAGVERVVQNSKLVQKALNTEYTDADRRATAFGTDKIYNEVAQWLDEQDGYSDEGDNGGKFNLFEGISEAGAFSNKNIVGKKLNDFARWNNSLLEKEDRWFVQKRARRAMAEMLQAQGYEVTKTESGYDITKDNKAISKKTLEAIEREALKNAQEATYHDFNQAAKAIENRKKSLGPAGTALDIIVPFTKTPANIMRRSIEFSPVGLARAVTSDLYKVRQGDMSASTYVTRLSRGLTGTAGFIVGALLANLGLLSKPDDDDEDGRTSYYEQNIYGKQNLALHVGDRYYSLDWAMPSSAPLMMGAAMANEFSKHGLNILDYDVKEVLSDGANALNPVLEASYLGSLNDFMTSYSQGINYGGNIFPAGTLGGMERAGSSIVENFAGQMVPTVGGAINRTLNGTKRTTSGNSMRERIENKVLAGTNSWALEPAIDEKGNEIENVGFLFGNNILGRAVYNFITPMTITEDTHDDLDSALMDVGAVALPRNQTGTGGLKGQILSDLNKAGMNLSDISDKEYTQVKKTYYGNYREYAKDYNELAEYNSLGTHARDDVYKKLEQLALTEAKATYYDKIGSTDELYSAEQKAALALKEMGVSPAQFYLIKDCGLSGNRKALYVMSELENLGVADDVVDYILRGEVFPSAFGLTDSIVIKTPDEREDAIAKYLADDNYETLESQAAAYRKLSNEEYDAKKKQDAEDSKEDSWDEFFKKYDKKYGTNYSALYGSGKSDSSKGSSSGSKSKSKSKGSGKKNTSKSSKSTKTKTTKASSSGGRRSSGGRSSSSTDSDEQALYDQFMKYAKGALNYRGGSSNTGISTALTGSTKLWDTIVNGTKKDVEALRRELKL